MWLVLAPLIGLALVILGRLIVALVPATGLAPIELFVEMPSGRLAVALVAVFVPVAEELFFRGFVFGTLERVRGTNVALAPGGHVWIGTTRGRVLRSTDDGRTWNVVQTPIATGEATGIFSIAFRDARHGVVVGGNYQQETTADRNVAITSDGGATWQAAAANRALSGYRSVVTRWAGMAGHWLAVGPAGSDWSTDDGRSWTPAGSDGYDAVSLAPGGAIGWATGAGGRIASVTLAR